jgi:hypothetical protein
MGLDQEALDSLHDRRVPAGIGLPTHFASQGKVGPLTAVRAPLPGAGGISHRFHWGRTYSSARGGPRCTSGAFRTWYLRPEASSTRMPGSCGPTNSPYSAGQ